ncbi:MAG: GTP-binding protein [Promethearchaeia archaeon]
MSSEQFSKLLNNFLEKNEKVKALIVSDRQGLMIAGEKREEIDMEIVSVLTAIVNPILERIRNEFAFQKFGTASFDTDNFRLLFISVDEEHILSLVLDSMASIDRISPYAFFLAEKIAQIIETPINKDIQLNVPDFQYDADPSTRLKNQIYQMRLESGGIYRFKFIIIGDHEVGKTSLVRRFVENKFSDDYRATIGLNIMSHSFDLYGNDVKVALYDVGAQKYFKRFRKTYYNGAQAAFIVFDLTNRKTFENIEVWFKELIDFIGDQDLPVVIVGNKKDLKDQRDIEYQEGVEYVNELSNNDDLSKISYIETSALTGENVEDAFSLIAYHFIMKSLEHEEEILKEEIYDEISEILDKYSKLDLSFITKSPYWSPGLQILTEIKRLGDFQMKKDENELKVYEYDNGLILKNFTYQNYSIANSDGVFCILDARGKKDIDPKWKEYIIEMIETIPEQNVILIGIRVGKNVDWSHLMEQLDVNEQLEQKMVSVLFFKIGHEYRLEIYDQLQIMLMTIKNH